MSIEIHQYGIVNLPVPLEHISVKLPTLREAFALGITKYLGLLQVILMDFQELELNLPEEVERPSDFYLFLMLMNQSAEYRNELLDALKLFTGVDFIVERGILISVEYSQIITEEVWIELREILYVLHWRTAPAPRVKKKALSERAKIFMERLEQTKKTVAKIKEKEENTEGIALYEIIAATATHAGSYNLLNIWDLTYYQFFDHYHRVVISDDYDISLKSILAGADPKKVEIKHWASSIKI